MRDTLSLNEVTSQLSTSKSKALLRDQIWFRQTVFTLSLTFILGLILSTKVKKQKETPLMKQYGQIKAEYPGTLLLFRVGDFYEM